MPPLPRASLAIIGGTGVYDPALFTHRMPGSPRQFAGLATGPDGDLYVSANGEGSLLRLAPRP